MPSIKNNETRSRTGQLAIEALAVVFEWTEHFAKSTSVFARNMLASLKESLDNMPPYAISMDGQQYDMLTRPMVFNAECPPGFFMNSKVVAYPRVNEKHESIMSRLLSRAYAGFSLLQEDERKAIVSQTGLEFIFTHGGKLTKAECMRRDLDNFLSQRLDRGLQERLGMVSREDIEKAAAFSRGRTTVKANSLKERR